MKIVNLVGSLGVGATTEYKFTFLTYRGLIKKMEYVEE